MYYNISMPLISTRADAVLKEQFRARAKTLRIKESALLQRLIRHELSSVSTAIPFSPVLTPTPQTDEDVETVRITVRLPRFLRLAVRERAAQRKMSESRWVAALIQSNLRKEPVMNDAEIAALLESNRELAALGRNLNQVARALNEAFYETERVKLEALGVLAAAIKENRDAIRVLVRASQQAWRNGQ